MTDKRSTARLLEAIAEQTVAFDLTLELGDPAARSAAAIGLVVDELRGRGDTLVPERDLREITELARRAITLRAISPDLTQNGALERLDDAIGETV